MDGAGMVLGPPKTAGARGRHQIPAGLVDLLRERRAARAAERLAAGPVWATYTYEGRPVSLVFTTLDGRLVNRQAITKAVVRAAERAGIEPEGLGPHGGRRTVVTALSMALTGWA